MKIVKPIHVREGEVVDIHWHLCDGKIFVERRDTPPPKSVREARESEQSVSPEK